MVSPYDDAPPGPSVSVTRVLAPNPGPMTLTGTNSYVIRYEDLAWVVDPGPKDAHHLAALIRLSYGPDIRPAGILLTHRHADHVDGAGTLRRQLENRSGHSVPLWATDTDSIPAALPAPASLFAGNDVIADILHLPGHTADSMSILFRGGRLLVGDTMLGGSPTVITEPDGNLTDYLQSLSIIRALAIDGRISSLHPGHGDEILDPAGVVAAVEEALEHRMQRIQQVREARAQGALTVDRIVRVIYGSDLDETRASAARSTVKATLRHITEIDE